MPVCTLDDAYIGTVSGGQQPSWSTPSLAVVVALTFIFGFVWPLGVYSMTRAR
jgi:hypothetical protein